MLDELRQCTRCLASKEPSEFYPKRTTQKCSWCKDCTKDTSTERKRRFKIECMEYKGGACARCGLVAHPSVYDFHHLDSNEKEFSPGNCGKTKLTDSIKSELDKCELLCSNCHRLAHHLHDQ